MYRRPCGGRGLRSTNPCAAVPRGVCAHTTHAAPTHMYSNDPRLMPWGALCVRAGCPNQAICASSKPKVCSLLPPASILPLAGLMRTGVHPGPLRRAAAVIVWPWTPCPHGFFFTLPLLLNQCLGTLLFRSRQTHTWTKLLRICARSNTSSLSSRAKVALVKGTHTAVLRGKRTHSARVPTGLTGLNMCKQTCEYIK